MGTVWVGERRERRLPHSLGQMSWANRALVWLEVVAAHKSARVQLGCGEARDTGAIDGFDDVLEIDTAVCSKR